MTERLLTVSETCRQQGRALLPYLQEAITALRRGAPAPSILAHAPTERLRLDKKTMRAYNIVVISQADTAQTTYMKPEYIFTAWLGISHSWTVRK
jgi:hypothetical protein